ncbi:maleylpyruvate isomerase family mycothiol-dependent enzyme [Mycobacterium sp. NPDC003449]
MADIDAVAAARLYHDTRERIQALLGTGGPLWNRAVAACPGWSVRDLVAHLTAVAEDWAAGRLSGAPTDDATAAQVARFEPFDPAELLAAWNVAAAQLDRLARTDGLTPPIGDIVVHEHDIRGALHRPGARDSAAAHAVAGQLLANLRTPVPVAVTVEDAEFHCGPDGEAEIRLSTSRFESLRWRTGRRSRAQLAAMDWSGEPGPVLEHLYLFGPAGADLIE